MRNRLLLWVPCLFFALGAGAVHAVVTFELQAGGLSTITVMPGTPIVADLVVSSDTMEDLGTYGISIDFGAGNAFVAGTNSPPSPLLAGAGPIAELSPGVASQYNGLGLFGTASLPGPVVIGTLAFTANVSASVAPFVNPGGIDGTDAVVNPVVQFSPLTLNVIPEPATGALLIAGLFGLAQRYRPQHR